MSAAEQDAPGCDWTTEPVIGEAERVRREDPEFPVVLAKARARSKGEKYDPERHGPFEFKATPRRQVKEAPKPEPIDTSALIARFLAKAPAKLAILPKEQPRNPYLRPVR